MATNGDTIATTVSSLTQPIIETTIRLLPTFSPMINLVTRVPIPKGAGSVTVPRVTSTFTVDTVAADGDELTSSQQLALTTTTITPALRAIRIRVGERAQRFAREDILSMISEGLAQAQAVDIDNDLTAQFTNFGLSVGTTNVDATIANVRSARRQLKGNTWANGGPAPAPIVCVVGAIPEENLMTDMGFQSPVAATSPFIPAGLSQDLIQSYAFPTNVAGVGFFCDTNIADNGSGDQINAMFSKKSLWFAVSKDWDMKTFEESDFVGVILRTVADYEAGLGAYSNWGVKLTFDGA